LFYPNLINLTKLKLEYLKSGCKCKTERYKHRQKIFCITLEFNFFWVQLKFAYKVWPLENFSYKYFRAQSIGGLTILTQHKTFKDLLLETRFFCTEKLDFLQNFE